jgi:Condensation domain
LVTNVELKRLSVLDKRQIVRALLHATMEAPRSLALSYSQEQLWFMDKLQPGSPLYNIPLYVPLPGPFDIGAVRRSLDTLMRRHDMLRVHFDSVAGEPRQIVEPDVAIDVPVEDLSRLAGDQRQATLGQLLNQEVQKSFDLSGGACVRYRLFRLDPGNQLLSVTMHHIVTDAWSLAIFVSELRTLYNTYRRGQGTASLPPLQLEYSDYAQWQRATLRGMRLQKLLTFWTTQLAGAPHVLHMPADHPRAHDQTFSGTVEGFVFAPELSHGVISLSRASKVTPFIFLLACYYILLYRYTGQDDIVVGAPVANRSHPDLEPIIGLFVNTLILRGKLRETDTFVDVLRRVNATALEAFEHQSLPFEKLLDELHVERVPGYAPLYQVVFNFQNSSLIESDNPLPEGEVMDRGEFPFVHSNTSKVDVNLTVTQNGSTISGGIEYNTDLFETATITQMIRHYKQIVETVVHDPSIPIMEIPLGTDEHRIAAVADQPRNGHARSPVNLGESQFSFERDE